MSIPDIAAPTLESDADHHEPAPARGEQFARLRVLDEEAVDGLPGGGAQPFDVGGQRRALGRLVQWAQTAEPSVRRRVQQVERQFRVAEAVELPDDSGTEREVARHPVAALFRVGSRQNEVLCGQRSRRRVRVEEIADRLQLSGMLVGEPRLAQRELLLVVLAQVRSSQLTVSVVVFACCHFRDYHGWLRRLSGFALESPRNQHLKLPGWELAIGRLFDHQVEGGLQHSHAGRASD